MRAWRPHDRMRQKGARIVGFTAGPGHGLGFMPASHGEQVPQVHLQQMFRRVFRHIRGEQVGDAVVQINQTLVNHQADGGGGKTFGQRVCRVDAIGGVRRPPSSGGHLAVADDHQTVELDGAIAHVVKVAPDGIARDAHRLRAGGGERNDV